MEINLLNRLKGFLKEVRIEGKKVTWPARKELTASTLVVVLTVVIVAGFIGLIDLLFSYLIKLLF